MSDENHLEIVKVWIDPGCIVCDACETDCPEVFEVTETTCEIRPDAAKSAFTQNLTPSIITAADGCPVDVIKFDTKEVEGPEPEAWKKAAEAAAAAANSGAGGGGGGGPIVAASREAPDPKWIGLLEASHIAGSPTLSASEIERTAKVPAAAIAHAVPDSNTPDAQMAAMVGSGYLKPNKSVADRIREKAAAQVGSGPTRRGFAVSVMLGWGAVAFVLGTFGAWFQSFMVPKAPILAASRVRVGKLENYSETGVYEDFKKDNIWILHLTEEGQEKVVALSTICTHLGCIPNWLPGPAIFKCPCHGSGYRANGVNFEGPAPRPLERYAIEVDATGVIIVDKSTVFRQELGEWDGDGSFIAV